MWLKIRIYQPFQRTAWAGSTAETKQPCSQPGFYTSADTLTQYSNLSRMTCSRPLSYGRQESWAGKDRLLGPGRRAQSQGTGWDMDLRISPIRQPERRQALGLTRRARLYPKACSNVGYQPAFSNGKSTQSLLTTQSLSFPVERENMIPAILSQRGGGRERRVWGRREGHVDLRVSVSLKNLIGYICVKWF